MHHSALSAVLYSILQSYDSFIVDLIVISLSYNCKVAIYHCKVMHSYFAL